MKMINVTKADIERAAQRIESGDYSDYGAGARIKVHQDALTANLCHELNQMDCDDEPDDIMDRAYKGYLEDCKANRSRPLGEALARQWLSDAYDACEAWVFDD